MSDIDLLRIIKRLESQIDSLKSSWNSGAHGWIPACEVWTRTGANTFTLAGQGNRTGIYQTGARLRCKQGGGWKYFYVVSSTYAAPTTTVTVTGGSDYTLAAATITDNWYSYVDRPQGFPDWFNWTPVYTGFAGGGDPTNTSSRFRVSGRCCLLQHSEVTDGASNAAGFTISLPITAAIVANATPSAACFVINNGVTNAIPGRARIVSAATVIDVYLDWANTGFAAANGKRAAGIVLSYEI